MFATFVMIVSFSRLGAFKEHKPVCLKKITCLSFTILRSMEVYKRSTTFESVVSQSLLPSILIRKTTFTVVELLLYKCCYMIDQSLFGNLRLRLVKND